MRHISTLAISFALATSAFATVLPHALHLRSPSESAGLLAAPAQVTAHVETWYDGATAAQSLTFDDNVGSQLKVLLPMLEARGLKGTFCLVTNYADYMIGGSAWDDWSIVKSKGHEIASHSHTHPFAPDLLNNPQGLLGLTPTEVTYELAHSKARLQERVDAGEGLIFAYPYSMYNSAIQAETASYYMAARAVSGDTELATPTDFFAIGAISWQQGHTWQQMASMATDRAIARGGWVVDLIHGCDGDGWSPPASTDYRQYFDYIKSKVDLGVLWVAPFGRVVRYIKERDAASVSVTVDNQSVYTVTLTQSQELPPGPVKLSVSFPVPWYWTAISATDEAGAPVQCRIYSPGGNLHALVEIMPEAPAQVAEVTVTGS